MLRALLERLLGNLTAFVTWWGEELVTVIPPRWRAVLFPPDDRPVLTIGPEVMVLARPQTGEEELVLWRQPVMPVGIVEVSDLTQAVGDKPVHVRFDMALGLSRQIVLPAMSRGDLGNAVLFQVEQLFPFRAEDVHIAHGGGQPTEAVGQVSVPVIVIERSVIDGWLHTLRVAGLRGASYSVLVRSTPFPFLRQPGPVDHRSRNLRAALAAMTIVLAAGTMAAWHAHREAYIAFLEQGINERKVVALDSRKLTDRITMATATRGWLEAEAKRPDLGDVLDNLARQMPDTAWAEQLEWRGKQLRLQGYAEDAVALPKQVSGGGLFENVQFRAAMNNRGDGAKERFDLTAAVKGSP